MKSFERPRSSDSRPEVYVGGSGENNPMYGKKHSEEAKEKMRGRKLSEETREKMSKANRGENNPMYGKKISEEHKEKISKAHKGKQVSEETREKMSKALRGRKLSEETKEKMRGRREKTRGENHYRYDQNISKVREAIRLCVEGSSMIQASLDMGFNYQWLYRWKAKYPERFRQFYMEEANDFDQRMYGKVHK